MKLRLSDKRRDRLPCTVLSALIVFAVLSAPAVPWSYVLGVVGLVVVLWAGERAEIRRDERDKMRAVAVALVRQWPDNDRADALNWVPDDILAAATPIFTAGWPADRAEKGGTP